MPQSNWGSLTASSCDLLIDPTSGECSVEYVEGDLSGTVTIEAVVVGDGTENRNTVEIDINKRLPDLTISIDTDSEKPIVLYPNQDIEMAAQLGNSGDADYEAQVTASIYLSKDDKFDAEDTRLVTLTPQSQMAKGALIEYAQTVTIPEDSLTGDYHLFAVANADQYLASLRDEIPDPEEKDYANNVAKLKIRIEQPRIEIEICVGNPISTNSGRKIETEVDYQGTGPFPLQFARYYSSRPGNTQGWNTSYSRRLLINGKRKIIPPNN